MLAEGEPETLWWVGGVKHCTSFTPLSKQWLVRLIWVLILGVDIVQQEVSSIGSGGPWQQICIWGGTYLVLKTHFTRKILVPYAGTNVISFLCRGKRRKNQRARRGKNLDPYRRHRFPPKWGWFFQGIFFLTAKNGLTHNQHLVSITPMPFK